MLEQKVFKYVCELGCEMTRIILESYEKAYVYLLDEAMQTASRKAFKRAFF